MRKWHVCVLAGFRRHLPEWMTNPDYGRWSLKCSMINTTLLVCFSFLFPVGYACSCLWLVKAWKVTLTPLQMLTTRHAGTHLTQGFPRRESSPLNWFCPTPWWLWWHFSALEWGSVCICKVLGDAQVWELLKCQGFIRKRCGLWI